MKLYTEKEIALMPIADKKLLINKARKIIDSLGLSKLKAAELYKHDNSPFLDDPKAVRIFLSLVHQNFVYFSQQINL